MVNEPFVFESLRLYVCINQKQAANERLPEGIDEQAVQFSDLLAFYFNINTL